MKKITKNLPKVALIGLPNSGKSTIFNRFSHSAKAIISDIENTTRDINQAVVEHSDKVFELIDTAGYTKLNSTITKIAMQRLLKIIQEVDVIVFVIDGTTELNPGDDQLSRIIRSSKKPVIVAANKVDNPSKAIDISKYRRLGVENIVQLSAIHGDGCDELLKDIVRLLPSKRLNSTKYKNEINISIIGRPNTGKSSLINSIAGEELAIESDIPGTTRDTNDYSLAYHGSRITFIDTAGMRKPGKIGKGEDIEFYSKVRTKKAIEKSDICLMTIDATEPATAQDLHLLGMIKDAKKGLVIVVTKWDLIDKDELSSDMFLKKLRSKMQFVWWAPVILTSAKQKQNIAKLNEIIEDIYSRLDLQIKTPELNRFLEDANSINPPSAVKTKHPKVNYITQTGNMPPKFTIFTTHPEYIHWSYTRFLENQLREKYQLNGVPVTIEYKSKYKEGNRDRYKKK